MNTLTVRPAAELDELVTAVRAAVARNADWRDTASYVADALREHLPPPELLPADLLAGERGTYRSHRLHVEPDGSFSMVAIAWQPGALTRIHDHVTWCVFGILAGVEYEDLYTLSDDGAALIEVGNNPNLTGEVTGFAPPATSTASATSATAPPSRCTSMAPTSTASAPAPAASTTSRSAPPDH